MMNVKETNNHVGHTVKYTFWVAFVTLTLAVITAAALYLFVWTPYQSRAKIETRLIGERLEYVQDLVTVRYHYRDAYVNKDNRQLFGLNLPLTQKRLIIIYEGVIKFGVDLRRVQRTVDHEAKTVTVMIPPAEQMGHEIPRDQIEVLDETRNILNQITAEEYLNFSEEREAEMEARAVGQGLLEEARERAAMFMREHYQIICDEMGYELIIQFQPEERAAEEADGN